MRRLHQSIIALVLWLSLLFNLEQLAPSFQLTPFLYLFIPIATVVTIWVVERYNTALQWVLGVGLLLYALLKAQFDGIAFDAELPAFISEMTSVAVSLLLGSAIGLRLGDIRQTLANLVIGQVDDEIVSFEQGQDALYREVRRARRRNHALTLLAISAPTAPAAGSVAPTSGAPFPVHVTNEMQQEFSRKYLVTRVGRVLLEVLEDTAIITLSNDHFVVLLPETPRDELQPILQKLQAASETKLGLKLDIGTATFPDEEITLESLIERAETAMINSFSLHNTQAVGVSQTPGPRGLTPVERSTNISSIS